MKGVGGLVGWVVGWRGDCVVWMLLLEFFLGGGGAEMGTYRVVAMPWVACGIGWVVFIPVLAGNGQWLCESNGVI